MVAPEEEVPSEIEILASMAGSFQLRCWPDGRLPVMGLGGCCLATSQRFRFRDTSVTF